MTRATTLLFANSGGIPAELILNGSTTILSSNTGWYSEVGGHAASNTNYLVGISGVDEFRDFFTFDLTNVGGSITSATLAVFNPAPRRFL
jgi:hypothetical protein